MKAVVWTDVLQAVVLGVSMLSALWVLFSHIPVSYTHLDVYKRQLPALRNAAQSLRKAQAVGLYMEGLFEEAHLRSLSLIHI